MIGKADEAELVAGPVCRQAGSKFIGNVLAYAIKSESRKYIYVGITNNLQRRISEHNKGYNKTTKPYKPFTLIHSEAFETRTQARHKEKYFKSGVGREFIKDKIL